MIPDLVVDELRQRPRRWLRRYDDHSAFAYVRGHEYIRGSDDTAWAHLADGQLLSMRSGEPLAYQNGSRFYDTTTHQPVYYQEP